MNPAPLARTGAEARLFMDLTPCESCGYLGFPTGPATPVFVEGVLHSQFEGTCPNCGIDRAFEFRRDMDLRLPHKHSVEFGDERPSELLDPGEWLTLAGRAARRSPAPTSDDLQLAAAAIEEVLKFIPDGADRVPAECFHTEAGRELFATEPGRFRRSRLVAVAQTYRDIAEGN
jgi:hypothetical protein